MRAIAIAAIVLAAACGRSTAPGPATAPSGAPASATASAPAKPAAKGQVVTRRFHSGALGVDKEYVVYLPAGYDDRGEAAPSKRYPVFYYLHGLGDDETDWIKGGHLDEAADELGLQAIVVMPDGDDGFYSDAVTDIDYDACMKDGTGLFLPGMQPRDKTCVRHRKYETYITHDLIHDVDTTYRTVANRDARAIAGLSMGGFGALELGMRHPDLFAAAASHSGVTSLIYAGPHPYVPGQVQLITDFNGWGKSAESVLPNFAAWMHGIFGADAANWKAHDPTSLLATLEPGKLALYIDCGTEDTFALEDQASYLHELLLAHKLDHAFFLGPGSHDFGFWRPRLPHSLEFLRDHTHT